MDLMSLLPWKKEEENEEAALAELTEDTPDQDFSALGGNGNALSDSEEEALLNQYFDDNPGLQATAVQAPAQDSLDNILGNPDPQELFEDEDDTEASADGDDDLDDVMSIFESEEVEEMDISAMTQGLEDIEAASLLTQARQITNHLARKF